MDNVPAANEDQRKGVEIVRHALKQPMMQIAKNAGVDASVIVNKVMEADDPNLGYDALNDVFVNMIDAGIIDPTKVCLTFLQYIVLLPFLFIDNVAYPLRPSYSNASFVVVKCERSMSLGDTYASMVVRIPNQST